MSFPNWSVASTSSLSDQRIPSLDEMLAKSKEFERKRAKAEDEFNAGASRCVYCGKRPRLDRDGLHCCEHYLSAIKSMAMLGGTDADPSLASGCFSGLAIHLMRDGDETDQ